MHPIIKSVLDFLDLRKKKTEPLRFAQFDVEEIPKLRPFKRRALERAKAQIRQQRLRTAGPRPPRLSDDDRFAQLAAREARAVEDWLKAA